MSKMTLGKTSNNRVLVAFKTYSISLYPTYTPTGMSIKEQFLEEREALFNSHDAKRLKSSRTAVKAILFEKERFKGIFTHSCLPCVMTDSSLLTALTII